MFDSNSKFFFCIFLLYLIHKYLIIKHMQEIWKDIDGFGGCYQVSNLGRVKSLDRNVKGNKSNYIRIGKILSPKTHRNGYLCVVLCKDRIGKMYYIHRLVAQAFIPNPDRLPQVNHKDENKTNNNVENLEWCSAEYNTNYGTANDRRCESLKKRNNNYNISII